MIMFHIHYFSFAKWDYIRIVYSFKRFLAVLIHQVIIKINE